MTYPNKFDRAQFASVRQAYEMGAVSVGRDDLLRQRRIDPPDRGNLRGLRRGPLLRPRHRPLVLHPQRGFQPEEERRQDNHTASDLTAQANHLGVTIQADIIKQKLPSHRRLRALNMGDSGYGKFDSCIYTELSGADENGSGGNLIELTRYQIANCYMGRPCSTPARQQRQGRPRRGRQDRRHQQTSRRHRADFRTQSLPAAR